MSPFDHPEDIISVTPSKQSAASASKLMPVEHLTGAVVTFRAVPGMTAEWLQRVVDCHLARSR